MNKSIALLLLLLFIFITGPRAQKIIPCDCKFKVDSSYIAGAPLALRTDTDFPNKIDSSFQTQCGYLIVPENRKKKNSRTIKLPFIIVKSKKTQKKKDPILFTSGGPGNSSLGWAQGITKSTLINDRDCIAFEQRGTRYAIPYLRSFELDNAWREAYRKNLSKDSMTLVALQQYKKTLVKRGIDLDGYNSDETVSDIHDLLWALQIDSVNLVGGSYSGGLMLAVLQKNPAKIRSLVLDSPLPMFSPIDEDEPKHFLEALHVLFRHVEKDSANQLIYANLEQRFINYFNAIADKSFYHAYLEKGTTDTIQVQYTKVELLEVLVGSMLDASKIKSVPFVITDIISGNHSAYISQRLDNIFNRYSAPDGMRIAVYCADQSAYHNEKIIQQFHAIYPFMKGFHINDVYKPMCDCWKIPPVQTTTKQAFYSMKPVLMGDGEMDPACSPLYMLQVKHYMPNAQTFIFINRGHGVAGKEFFGMTQQFIDNPYQQIIPPNTGVIAY